jgi:hypothetical protein
MRTLNAGKKAMIQMAVSLSLLACLIIWKIDFIRKVYFTTDQTMIGYIINGAIIILFISGIIKLGIAFLHYAFEEDQIRLFIASKHTRGEVAENSIITRRYDKIKLFYEKQIPINHGVMSSIMLAEESLYQSFPKFVNNILILLGVFGTIISLILALAGASDILVNSIAGNGMWQIIHGMNTALTTTATAIICFFFFTFFYHKLTDIQTHVFSRVEDAVMAYIVPEFSFDIQSINQKTDRLVNELGHTVTSFKNSSEFIEETLAGLDRYHSRQLEIMETISEKIEEQDQKSALLVSKFDEIIEVLNQGFRLKGHD